MSFSSLMLIAIITDIIMTCGVKQEMTRVSDKHKQALT